MAKSKVCKDHPGRSIENRNGYEVIDCTSCRFKHIIPIPSHEELREIYRSEYYATEKPLYIERNQEDQEW